MQSYHGTTGNPIAEKGKVRESASADSFPGDKDYCSQKIKNR